MRRCAREAAVLACARAGVTRLVARPAAVPAVGEAPRRAPLHARAAYTNTHFNIHPDSSHTPDFRDAILKYPSLTKYPIFAVCQTSGSCHKRQKPQAPTSQAPIRNRQTRKVANAKVLNRNTNLT